MESEQIKEEVKDKLKKVYDNLNPAELKRNLDKKLQNLYKAYQKKNGSRTIVANKKLATSMSSFRTVNLK